jgi:hypothetical protein
MSTTNVTIQRGKAGSRTLTKLLGNRFPAIASAAPVNAVAATRVLTMDTQPTAGDTITIGSTVYTWKTSGAVAGEINRGADLAAAKVNLVAAINGTDGINTAHPDVSAATFSTHAMTITARVKGAAANAIATTETFTAGTNIWAGATMTGGVNGTPGTAYEQRINGTKLYINASAAEKGSATDKWHSIDLTLVS